MTILTTIALVGCLFVLFLGGASMLASAGKTVDLRNRFRRLRVAGGRRTSDPAQQMGFHLTGGR